MRDDTITLDMNTRGLTARDVIRALRAVAPETMIVVRNPDGATRPLTRIVGARTAEQPDPKAPPVAVVLV